MSNIQNFDGKIIGGIGRTKLDVNLGNPFPFINETVDIEALTRWSQKVIFEKKESPDGNAVTEEVQNISQRTISSVVVKAPGDVPQTITAENHRAGTTLFSATSKKFLYPMEPQELPYFEPALSSEINRTNEFFKIIIHPDNGYDLSRESTVDVFVLKENGQHTILEDVALHLTKSDFTLQDGNLVSSDAKIDKRGIYDLYIEYTDLTHTVKISKRINKLLTITPRLAQEPTADALPFASINSETAGAKIDLYKTGVNDLYMIFEIPNLYWYKDIDLKDIPSGYDCYTMVLRKKENRPDGNETSRVRFTNSTAVVDGITNPSPQFSYDNPLVITHDEPVSLELHGESYNTMAFNNLWHSIIDGRGYHNASLGLKLNANPVTGVKPTFCIQYAMGSSFMEIFEVEMTGCSFAALSAKTDPTDKNPWYWFENFEQDSMWVHHVSIHDTEGEGVYLGYFTPEIRQKTYTGQNTSFTNTKGETVSYENGVTYDVKAHYLTNFRFYRNVIERTGFDGIQISNTIGEICYNTLRDCSWKEEINQTSGASIQSFAGKVYNNFVYESYGPSLQLGPIGEVELFNNIFYSSRGMGVQFLFSYSTPEQNPTGQAAGSGVVNDAVKFYFFNNVIATPGVTGNGRNTVQMTGLHMYDNVIANNGTLFSNMSKETLAKWQSQAVNNAVFNFSDIIAKSHEYKIADYVHGDFRVAFDSPLINTGLGTSFKMDYRGYLDWFGDGTYPIGPFMGKYKLHQTAEDPLVFNSIMINNGSDVINQREVSVTMNYREGSTTAAKYRAAETEADLPTTVFVDIQNPFTFTFSEGYGTKTIYVQLLDSAGIETQVISKSVQYEKVQGEVTAVSVLWGKNEFDDVNKVNKVASSLTPFELKSNKDNVFCSIARHTANTGYMVFKDTYAGATTGNNSFEYPDEYMHRAAVFGSRAEVSRGFIFTGIKPGKYCVRIFASNINASVSTDRSVYKIITGDGTDARKEYLFDNPKEIVGNITDWMVQEVDIPQEGSMMLDQGISAGSAYVYTSMNIIEIKEPVAATNMRINILENANNTIKLGCELYPDDTTQTEVEWSFKNPTQNASIDRFGVITVNPSATQEETVEVIAVNKFNTELTASLSIQIKYTF